MNSDFLLSSLGIRWRFHSFGVDVDIDRFTHCLPITVFHRTQVEFWFQISSSPAQGSDGNFIHTLGLRYCFSLIFCLRFAPFQLRGQTGTTAATRNTEDRQHHKSDADSDCGQDSCVLVPPSPAAKSRGNLTHQEPEQRQARSVDDPADPRPGDAEPPRLRTGREGSRSWSKGAPPPQGCPGGVSSESLSQQSSIRVNGLTVQSKAARGVKELDRARHVNEA